MTEIERLAVVERGEAAARILSAASGLRDADGGTALTTVLIHCEDPENAWYAREADEVVAVERAEDLGHDAKALVAQLQDARADAVWLGRWSDCDRAEIVRACEQAGIAVVGPSGDTIAELCTAPGLCAVAGRAGVACDPSAGGGRQIEVDVLADRHGTTWVLEPRDITARLGERLILAETPAALDAGLHEQLLDAARAVAGAAGYVGAGTLRFDVPAAGSDAAITLVAVDIEVRPLHAMAEELIGLSLIGQRIRVAQGHPLPPQPPTAPGHTAEVRLYAGHSPGAADPATVALLSLPVGIGVRVDARRREGDPVTVSHDPLVAVFTAFGPDRAATLFRMRRALERTTVVLSGGVTNRPFLLAVLADERLRTDAAAPGWLDDAAAAGDFAAPPDPIALAVAAIEAYEADLAVAQSMFYANAERGRPELREDVGTRIALSYRGHSYAVQVSRISGNAYQVKHDDAIADLRVDRVNAFERRVGSAGTRHRAVVSPYAASFAVELDGASHTITREEGHVVRTAGPALVVALLARPGDRVRAGDPIAVLESMKMESTVSAPFDGTVTSLAAGQHTQLEAGAALLRIRPDTEQSPEPEPRPIPQAVEPTAPVTFDGLTAEIDFGRLACLRVYEPLEDYLLGYDLRPAELKRLLTQQRRLGEIAEASDANLVSCEDGLLDLFADLGALYRPHTAVESEAAEFVSENTQEYFLAFVQWLDADRAGLPPAYRARLERALSRYGVTGLDRSPELESAVMWMYRSFARVQQLAGVVVGILQRRLAHRDALVALSDPVAMRERFERLEAATQGRQQAVADLARDVLFYYFDEPVMLALRTEALDQMNQHLDYLRAHPGAADREDRINELVSCRQPLRPTLLRRWIEHVDDPGADALREAIGEVYLRRFYRVRPIGPVTFDPRVGCRLATTEYTYEGERVHIVACYAPLDRLPAAASAVAEHLAGLSDGVTAVVELICWRDADVPIEETEQAVTELLRGCEFGSRLHRLNLTIGTPPADVARSTQYLSYLYDDEGGFAEELIYRNLHPMLGYRLELWRLSNFTLDRRPAPEDVYLFYAQAKANPKDRRLFAHAEIRDLGRTVDPATGAVSYPQAEHTALQALVAMRSELTRYPPRDRPRANRMVLSVRPPWIIPASEAASIARRIAPLAASAGLEKVVLKVRLPDPEAEDGLRDAVLHIEGLGTGLTIREDRFGDEPVRPLTEYRQKVLVADRFGIPYPYEIVRMLTPQRGAPADLPPGDFVELDLDEDDNLVPVDREPGRNSAHLVVGLITNYTDVVPEGISRVAMLSDPTQGLGNLAEPECRRINAALAYALEHRIPVEWYAASSGALIAMDSGTENMDWIALTLRRLIEYTQAGGEINIIVTGINVGGQPYWNAEATMLNHTKGVLIMTPSSTMVLTGKQALEFSGAVSAEDNFGIGGYDKVMGRNGQGQYWAPSFKDACAMLLHHYDFTYVVPGERFPRRRPTADDAERDVRTAPHDQAPGTRFTTVGEIFSAEANPERKQPFDMRSVMRAVSDADARPLERWQDLRDGENSIVWDTTVGGIPVCMLGLESRPLVRKGFVPSDGPPMWTSGTLFPQASRKTERAINAATGNRPLVVLANLSGFDGSPESMRRRQLEYGAEIGRAITNFDGPIVFVVVSRYHGGAFVVFSKALNESMEIAAVEGSFASVIGGAPAAATVFARLVKQRTEADPRVAELREALADESGAQLAALRVKLSATTEAVRSEKLAEVADEFDSIHTIERAQRVGSVDRIVPAAGLRPYVIDALERGMAKFG